MRAAVFLSKWFHVASTEWFVGVFVNFGGCVLSKFFFFQGNIFSCISYPWSSAHVERRLFAQ